MMASIARDTALPLTAQERATLADLFTRFVTQPSLTDAYVASHLADRTLNVEPRLLISVKETARLLGGVSEREVYRCIYAGDLESVKEGRRRLVTRASLDAHVGQLITAGREQK